MSEKGTSETILAALYSARTLHAGHNFNSLLASTCGHPIHAPISESIKLDKRQFEPLSVQLTLLSIFHNEMTNHFKHSRIQVNPSVSSYQ